VPAAPGKGRTKFQAAGLRQCRGREKAVDSVTMLRLLRYFGAGASWRIAANRHDIFAPCHPRDEPAVDRTLPLSGLTRQFWIAVSMPLSKYR
jgi:hypothetical protein